MARLDGRVALVTGGAKGIGRHYSFALAAEGARVMIADARYGLPARNRARLYREATISLCASGRLAKAGASDE